MGKNIMRVFQRWVRNVPDPNEKQKFRKPYTTKPSEEFNVNYAAEKKDDRAILKIQPPSLDPTLDSNIYNMVFNTIAKNQYKKKSDAFKRLISYDNELLGLYSAIDSFVENPWKVTTQGIDRQLARIWTVLKDQHKEYQCTQCLTFFNHPQALRVHLQDISATNELCYHFAKPTHIIKILQEVPPTVLMIDDETFFCNFGCRAQTTDIRCMLKHFIETHTREELASWSLGYDWMYRIYRYG